MSVSVGVCFIVSIVIDIVLIFLCSISVIEFDEIRTTKKSPVEQCNFLNPLVVPEYSLHAVLTVIFLFVADWMTCIINLGLLGYHVYRYSRRPVMSGCGLYCPTTLLTSQEIRRGQLEGWAKLATYILLFFYSLYGFVTTPSYHLKHAP